MSDNLFMERCAVLILVHDSAHSAAQLCRELAGRGLKWVCVCTGDISEEAYAEISQSAAAAQCAEAVRYNGNAGSAMEYGITYIAENYAECRYIAAVNADMGYSEADVVKAAEAVCKNGGLVIGAQKCKNGFGGFFNKLSGGVLSAASGAKFVSDIRFGLMAFELERAELFANIIGKAYTPCVSNVNLLFRAVEEKIPVSEIETSAVGENWHIAELYRLYKSIFLASRSLKYLFSSGVAFILDYILLLLFDRLIPSAVSMELAAPIAWVVSSLTNFFINRNFVFRSNAPLAAAIPEYYGLAGTVFVLKTYVLLELMTRVMHIPLWIAKLFAEAVFFVSNYFIQKKLIFRKK